MKKNAAYILLAILLIGGLCGCRDDASDARPSLSPVPASPTIAPPVEDETGEPLESGMPGDDGMIFTPHPDDGRVRDEDGLIDDDDTGTKPSPGNKPSSGAGSVTGSDDTKKR